MRLKAMAIVLAASLTAPALGAAPEKRFSFGGDLGMSLFGFFEVYVTPGFQAGYSLSKVFRLSAEGSFASATSQFGRHIEMKAFAVSLLAEAPSGLLRPFAGMGIARVDLVESYFGDWWSWREECHRFAPVFRTGLAVAVAPAFQLWAEARIYPKGTSEPTGIALSGLRLGFRILL